MVRAVKLTYVRFGLALLRVVVGPLAWALDPYGRRPRPGFLPWPPFAVRGLPDLVARVVIILTLGPAAVGLLSSASAVSDALIILVRLSADPRARWFVLGVLAPAWWPLLPPLLGPL